MSDQNITQEVPLFVLHAPFDADGDVILRSSDGIDFNAYRVVLSLVSPVFKAMFTLPQPASDPDIPIIPLSESAVILDRALKFWYPGAEPVALGTLTDLREILDVLILKYDIRFIISHAKSRLRAYLETDPVSVFAIACRHEWKELAQEAAKRTLGLPIRSFDSPRLPQLGLITGDAYHGLLHYHSQCAMVATSATSSLRWLSFPNDFPGTGCPTSPSLCSWDDRLWEFSDDPNKKVVAWIGHYLKGLTEIVAKTPHFPLEIRGLLDLIRPKLAACTHCSQHGYDQLAKFSATLKAHIDREIDSVELNLNI